ncbi:unnamed protein product [Gulo gulo]|uniref:Uncharacterized protein n=1 Tax=Gulo gulo TaxID=48420 RepID=A0A9X9M7U4_GULGU|nr:unnamed protein product [Gulo gulo]
MRLPFSLCCEQPFSTKLHRDVCGLRAPCPRPAGFFAMKGGWERQSWHSSGQSSQWLACNHVLSEQCPVSRCCLVVPHAVAKCHRRK